MTFGGIVLVLLIGAGLLYEYFFIMALCKMPTQIGFGYTIVGAIITVALILLWYWKIEEPKSKTQEGIDEFRKKGKKLNIICSVSAIGFCIGMFFLSPEFRDIKERIELGDELYNMEHDTDCIYPGCSRKPLYNQHFCSIHTYKRKDNSGSGSSNNTKPSNSSSGSNNRHPNSSSVERDFEEWYEDHEDEYDNYDDAYDAWEDGDY